MKIPYNWLKDYVEVTVTPEQLADDLSSFGFTIENLVKTDTDTILDLEINPNRGDCLSILGIAREVGALYNINLKSQNPNLKIDEKEIDKNIMVTISDPDICPRFTARIIDGIEIKPSPKWLQDRLIAYGFRPINNIVDITNYVMVATGQPMHAFDYDKIKNGKMNIRLSKEGEELMTLDGKNHKLPEGVIIIEDDEKIYDLAGIMGGIKSEIDEKTKTIILESAIFDAKLIRRASKKLNHTTDASYRYERGVDTEGTIDAANFATSLIKESCPNAKSGKLIDIQEKKAKQEIVLDLDKVKALLGVDNSPEDIKKYLDRLNFKASVVNGKVNIIVPSYRIYDVKIWQDVAEEIIRIYGYDRITNLKLSDSTEVPINPDWQKRETVKDELKNMGLTEVCSYSLIDKKQVEIFNINLSDCVEIANPLSAETQYMRPSLLPSLLSQVSHNPWSPEILIFELGKVFVKGIEKWQVGIVVTNNMTNVINKAIKNISCKKDIINIDQKILDFYKIRRGLKAIICDVPDLKIVNQDIKSTLEPKQYREISKYPPTVRDLAFIVNESIIADDIIKTICDISDNIFLVELFDEYSSDKFGANKKNLAFHIWLQDLQHPMDESKTNTIIANIIKIIQDKFEAKLRS